jgi:hemoglobin
MESLYDRLGGDAAIDAAVDVFYQKMLSDDRVNHFFEGIDMKRQRAKQKGFLTMVTGGPKQYSGKSMREGHKHLIEKGLNDSHVDIVIEHLGNTLKELGVSDSEIGEVAALANSVRDDVLNR